MGEQVPRSNGLIVAITAGLVLAIIHIGSEIWVQEFVAVGRGKRNNPSLNSMNNVKNLMLAVLNNASSVGVDGAFYSTSSDKLAQSWRVQALPLLDQSALYRRYDPALPWNEGGNADISRTWIDVFVSRVGNPPTVTAEGWAPGSYGMISGPGTVNPGDRRVTLDDIAEGNGLTHTLSIVECAGLQLAWAEPRDPHIVRQRVGVDTLTRPGQTSNALISTFSRYGPPVAFADGSARSLSPNVDPRVLRALCTIDDGETVSPQQFAEAFSK